LEYRFEGPPGLRRVAIDLELRDGRIAFDIAGPASFLLRQAVKMYCNWLGKFEPLAQVNGANVYSLYVPPVPSPAHARMLGTFLRRWVYKERAPMAVTIGVTTACQLSCCHCSAATVEPSDAPLAVQEIARVVDECLDLGASIITFTGGEPLLRDDLERCIRHVPAERAATLAFTNGLALDVERAASLRAAGTFGVHISLDAPEPERHDALRGRRGVFQAVEAATRAARSQGLLAGLATYASNEAVERGDLAGIASLAAEWGANEISVFDVLPVGRLLGRTDLLLSARNRRSLLAESKRLNEVYRGRLRIVTQSWTNCGWGFAWFIGCLAGNYQFHINANGDLTPCDFTPVSFGNVRREPVAALWARMTEHPAYRDHRKSCRLQSRRFRRRYIDAIPDGAPLPFPAGELRGSS
jgi:MoaA/NifB/PqqE/SkfB family radical SAM enzyme